MHIVDLSNLTPAQAEEWQRRYQANLQLYSLTEIEALKGGNSGMIAKVAANVALHETSTRRQPIWSKR
ncbi:hypothetical protein Kim5_CH02892 [Rhizobium sp. Kim5]|uniref:hypothetical protein n=1 Tax=Rhizobium sp. Kim5 TaxID=2020311 RepID=UPI0001902ACE|nr:hypothetical protein [Rhizobium sp. Kim5]ARQ58935.1 hypothetical protein Kim5_CH02892 [Rhizobium sp. Kim5]